MPKVIVNHTGASDGHPFTAGQPVDLPQNVVDALGDDAQLVEKQAAKSQEDDNKPSYKELQAKAKELGLPTNAKYDDLKASIEAKEAEAPINKMVGEGETVTK